MDISAIQTFHNYQPLFDEDPKEYLDAILKKADYLTKDELDLVHKAYRVSRDAHAGVVRHSWEPYIVHPVRVLEFLMMLRPDVASLQAALLHDVVEDTDTEIEEIIEMFWEEVAELCEGLEKVSKVRFSWEARQLETLKKTFLAMWKDLRVIFIKLADRIHNIQTLHYHPKKEKIRRIAEETLKVYVPIAKRLWLYVYQGYLENWAFKNRDYKEYKRIYTYVIKKYGDVDRYRNWWIDRLTDLCAEENIPYLDIKWRLKSPYRIYKKLKKYQTKDISKVMDVLAFRVLTKSVGDCYNMLWVIHKHYTPIFAKMKDYIALPKPNGYRSLHTTILWMFDFPVEIQVRTKAMEEVAEYWVAAHFAYAEAWTATSISEKQVNWIQNLQEIVTKFKNEEDKDWFKQHLNIEILQKNIFVYTPKGDIIELPAGSKVLDFAFRVHTDIGLKFKTAFINGRIVPLDYKLKTWDIVDIKTFKSKISAKKWWENYLHTPTAKTKLTRYLRQLQKESTLKQVTDSINERLHIFQLPLLWSKEDKLKTNYGSDDREQILWKVYDKQITPTKLLRTVYNKEIEAMEKTEVARKAEKRALYREAVSNNLGSWGVIIDGDKELTAVLCPACKPWNTQKIIAKTDRWSMKIHTLDCEALATIKSSKLYEAHRKGSETNRYTLHLYLKVVDKPWKLLKVLQIFEFFEINFNNLTTSPGDGIWSDVELDLDMPHVSKIDFLMKELKSKTSLLKIIEKDLR